MILPMIEHYKSYYDSNTELSVDVFSLDDINSLITYFKLDMIQIYRLSIIVPSVDIREYYLEWIDAEEDSGMLRISRILFWVLYIMFELYEVNTDIRYMISEQEYEQEKRFMLMRAAKELDNIYDKEN